MKSKIGWKQAAAWAMANGYAHLAAVVKSYRGSTYYHELPALAVATGGWSRCAHGRFESGAHGPIGNRLSSHGLPAGTIWRSDALAAAREAE
jgi:hypothetical protein